MNQYDIFITNQKDGIHRRGKRLGRIESQNLQTAEYEADQEFSGDIWAFCQVYGTNSIVFPVRVQETIT